MLKTLYEHFAILYEKILPTNPTLASEHALKQEEDVYQKANKLTYRNVCSRLCDSTSRHLDRLLGCDFVCSSIEEATKARHRVASFGRYRSGGASTGRDAQEDGIFEANNVSNGAIHPVHRRDEDLGLHCRGTPRSWRRQAA